jgi:phospholipid/cholesterol/gamma-HCH transport system substrate-binding protein
MSPRRRNIIVGLVVLLGLGVIVWMILLFAGRLARLIAAPGIMITLSSERADGLTDGSAVYYRGVQVGRVNAVHLRQDNQGVTINVEINKGVDLPANLHATIRTSSAFGNSADILLEPTGAPEGTLTAGATLSATFEGSALIPKQFTELAEDMKRQQLITHLDETVVSIRQQAERAGQLVGSVQELIGDKKMAEDLRVSLANIRNATESANRVGANMERFSGKLDKLSDQTTATMSEVRVAVVRLGTTLDHFQSVAAKIDEGKGTAGLLVNDPKLYQGLVDTTKELNLTIADLQRVVQQWEQEGVTLKLGK